MRNPVTSAPKFATYSSFDRLAATLIKSCGDVFQKPGKPLLPRSLGAKIGMLDKGDRTWWASRPDEAKCLAKLLGLEFDELGLNQKSGRHIFDFASFPELPALDLMREDGWKIAEPEIENDPQYHRYNSKPTLDDWLKSTGFCKRNQVEWLYVPDEVEYQLLTRKLAAACRHEILPIKSLSDVLDNDSKLERVLQQEPLVLTLETGMTLEDVKTLASYRKGAPLLIISTSWLVKPDERNPADEKSIKINRWTWNFSSNWRESLLTWIEQRINSDTLFTSEGAKRLLKKFDPGHILFERVKDVLVLCQALHDHGENKISTNDEDTQLLSLFELKEPSQDLLSPLIEARWKRWDLAWSGELPRGNWMALAEGLCDFDVLTKHLIVRGVTGYDFQRPIVIRLLMRSYLSEKFIKGELTSWAPACFDCERRLMVDDALDAISLHELGLVAQRFMQESTSAQNVGACESIFTAIGRRIIRKEQVSNELSAFAGHLIKQLRWDEQDKDFLRPWSLRLDKAKEHIEWVSVCWAWSLQPPPPMQIPSSWLFPGWSSSLPAEVPGWLNGSRTNQNYLSSNWERQAIPLKAFLTVVERWMKKLEAPPQYENSPSIFFVALLARAGAGDWPAEEWWWLNVIGEAGSPLVEQALLDLAQSENISVNRRTALNWWPSLVQYLRSKASGSRFLDKQTRSNLFTQDPQIRGYSEALVWVMKQLAENPKVALEALEEEDRKFLVQHPSALSAAFKRALLTWLVKGIPSGWMSFQLLDLFSYYGRDVVEEMEVFLDDSEQLGRQAAQHLWEWAPDRAKNLLEKALTQTATQNLIRRCPPSALGAAIKLLQNDPNLLQEERLLWARWHLPDARQHAQELMALIETSDSARRLSHASTGL